MNFHKDQADALEPCKHMESMLNRTAEGSAPKLMELYARSHAKRCVRCGTFLAKLVSLLGGLRLIKSEKQASPIDESLSPDRWETLESRWAEVEG